jgi:hypothetical protein
MAQINDTDIRLDAAYQLTQATNGDAPIASGLDCVFQDIQLEAHSQEGELFYDEAWGWSLLDFLQSEDDELLRLEIQERIKEKLARRSEVDVETITTLVSISDDTISIHTTFSFISNSQTQTVDVDLDRVKVEVTDNA